MPIPSGSPESTERPQPNTPWTPGSPFPKQSHYASQRALLRWLTASAIVLLFAGTVSFLWLERERALDDAGQLATRRANKLAQELEQSLTIASKVIEQSEARLKWHPTQSLDELFHSEADADKAALLASLPLPFELHAVDRTGHATDLFAYELADDDNERSYRHEISQLSSGRWQVSDTQDSPDGRVVPLIWAAAPNTQGLAAYGVDLSFHALLKRLESERVPNGGGVALFRLGPGERATLLARAPFVEAHLGQTADPGLSDVLSRSASGVFDTQGQLDGVTRRVAFQRLTGVTDQLVIVYGLPVSGILAGWFALLPFVLGTAGLLALALGYGGWRLERSLKDLSNSEQRFRLASASGHVWDWNIKTGVLRAPAAIWSELGLPIPTPEQSGKQLEAVLPPWDRQRLYQRLRDHFLTRQPFAGEFRLRNAQGQLRWFEVQGQASWDENDRATYMAGTAFDISDQRALEEAQRQTLHRLDTVANASPALVWTSDREMRCDWVNQRWLEFTGRPPEEELNSNWTQGMHPDDQRRCETAYAQAFGARQPFSLEFRLLRRDGQYRRMLDQGLPRYDADGRFLGYIGTCMDITDLKAAEEAARQQTQLLDRVFDVLPDLFFLLDEQGTIIDYKAGSTALLYAPPAQFIGGRVQDVMPAEFAAPFMAKVAATASGTLQRHEYTLPMADGLHHFEARLARLPNGRQLLAIVRDNTEQKLLEQERERLNQFTFLLFGLARNFINLPHEQAREGIDRALSDLGTYVEVDRAYVLSYDLDSGTATTSHQWRAANVVDESEQQPSLLLSDMADMLDRHQRGEVFEVERATDLPEGALRSFLLSRQVHSFIALPLMSHGQCVGCVGFDTIGGQRSYTQGEVDLLQLFAQMMVNVDERHTAEHQVNQLKNELEARVLQRTQALDASVKRLRQVNAELETFTYSVSHDLKSPLRSLEGFCTLLLEDHAHQLDAQGQDYLGRIQRAARHMALLINDLLAYSRIEKDEQRLERLPLLQLVREATEGVAHELESCDARLEVDIPEGLMVRAASQGMAMVLRNLLDNALKFRRPKEPLIVRIAAQAQDHTVHLSVTDNGMGFDMKYHDRIFALFQRLHRQDQIPGTGIGLAMVHKAVENMGGRIWAESEPGHGACFHMELPRA